MLQKNPCTKRQSLGSSAHQNLRQDSVKVPVKTLKWDVERSERKRAAFWQDPLSICVHLYPISLGASEPVIWGDFPGLPTNHLATCLHYFAWFCIPSACLLHVFWMFCFVPHRSLPKYRAIGAWCGTKPQSQTMPWTSWAFTEHAQPSSTFQGTQQQFTTPTNILLD